MTRFFCGLGVFVFPPSALRYVVPANPDFVPPHSQQLAVQKSSLPSDLATVEISVRAEKSGSTIFGTSSFPDDDACCMDFAMVFLMY